MNLFQQAPLVETAFKLFGGGFVCSMRTRNSILSAAWLPILSKSSTQFCFENVNPHLLFLIWGFQHSLYHNVKVVRGHAILLTLQVEGEKEKVLSRDLSHIKRKKRREQWKILTGSWDGLGNAGSMAGPNRWAPHHPEMQELLVEKDF